jgi:hypothetical protein
LDLFGDFYTGSNCRDHTFAEMRMQKMTDDCSMPKLQAQRIQARLARAEGMCKSCQAAVALT